MPAISFQSTGLTLAAWWLPGTQVVPADQLMDHTIAYARELIAHSSPSSMAHTPRPVAATSTNPLCRGQAVGALVSDNPAYRTIELPPQEVEVIGRVVWKSGRI